MDGNDRRMGMETVLQENGLEPEGLDGEVVKRAVFPDFEEPRPEAQPIAGFEVLMDVPLAVSVELGRARCFVKDLLEISVGSIIELDKAAGEVVDVLVNGRQFARGEVVIVDENFGVRLTEIARKGAADKGARKIQIS